MNKRIWLSIYERLIVGLRQREPIYRVAMIVNQIGSLSKAVSYKYAYSYGKAPEWDAEVRISLSDLFAMTLMMAINEGINIDELEDLAFKRLDEFVKKRLPR